MCEECLQPIQVRTRPAGCMCGCNFRSFLSADEETKVLEQCKKQLQGELADVDGRIRKLKQG